MRGLDDTECEKLLTREGRATLSLWRQLIIYLDPFALFADSSVGPAWRRQRAISFNRERRSILLTYIRRWMLIAVVSLLGVACTEALTPFGLIPAAGFGISCSIAVVVAVCAGTTYLLLGVAR
jgi:hypothetical protein